MSSSKIQRRGLSAMRKVSAIAGVASSCLPETTSVGMRISPSLATISQSRITPVTWNSLGPFMTAYTSGSRATFSNVRRTHSGIGSRRRRLFPAFFDGYQSPAAFVFLQTEESHELPKSDGQRRKIGDLLRRPVALLCELPDLFLGARAGLVGHLFERGPHSGDLVLSFRFELRGGISRSEATDAIAQTVQGFRYPGGDTKTESDGEDDRAEGDPDDQVDRRRGILSLAVFNPLADTRSYSAKSRTSF